MHVQVIYPEYFPVPAKYILTPRQNISPQQQLNKAEPKIHSKDGMQK